MKKNKTREQEMLRLKKGMADAKMEVENGKMREMKKRNRKKQEKTTAKTTEIAGKLYL